MPLDPKTNDDWFKRHCGPKAKCNKFLNEKTAKERRRAWFLRIFGVSEEKLAEHHGYDFPDEEDCF